MQIERVVETCLYVDDVEASADWYERVLDLDVVTVDPPRHAFLQAGESMVLLFDPDETEGEDQDVPPHGARGPQHVAFAVEDVPAWREQVTGAGVDVVHDRDWGEGTSFYIEDPEGHVVELVSRDVWPVW